MKQRREAEHRDKVRRAQIQARREALQKAKEIEARNRSMLPTGAGSGAPPPHVNGYVNVKEVMKADIGYGPGNAHFALNRPDPAKAFGFSDEHLSLDSWSRNQENSNLAKGRISWNIGPPSRADPNEVGVFAGLRNVIEAQLCGDFGISAPRSLYYTAAAITATAPGGALPAGLTLGAGPAPPPAVDPSSSQSQLDGSAVYVGIAEAGRQAYKGNRGLSYNFVFDAEASDPADPDGFTLASRRDCTSFVFTEPLAELEKVTLTFAAHNRPIALPPDIVQAVFIFALNGDLSVRITDESNLLRLEAGDRIFIRDSAPFSGVLSDDIAAYFTRDEGLIIGTITTDDNPTTGSATTLIEFPFEPLVTIASAATVEIENVELFIEKNQIVIPARFRCILDRITNYKDP